MDPFNPNKDKYSTPQTQDVGPSYQHDSLAEDLETSENRPGARPANVFRAIGFILLHQLLMAVAFILLTLFLVMPSLPEKMPGGEADLRAGSQLWEQIQIEMMSADNTAITSIVASLLMIPLTSLYLWKRRKSNPFVVMTQKPQSKDWTWSIWALLAAQGLSMAWLHFLDWASQYSSFVASRIEVYEQLMTMIADENVNVALALLATCILVPIMEELIYRGVVMGELRQICKDRTALIIQAAIFGLIHANFIQSVYAFVLGLVIGYIYYKTQSLTMSILSHMLFNFLGGGLPILVGEDSLLIQVVFILELVALVTFLVFLVARALRPADLDGLEDGGPSQGGPDL